METFIQRFMDFLIFLGAISTFFAIGCIVSDFIDRKLEIEESADET